MIVVAYDKYVNANIDVKVISSTGAKCILCADDCRALMVWLDKPGFMSAEQWPEYVEDVMSRTVSFVPSIDFDPNGLPDIGSIVGILVLPSQRMIEVECLSHSL